jgi:ABC-type multidrug transport system permease subunit
MVCLVALALAHGVVPSLFVLFFRVVLLGCFIVGKLSCINLAHSKKKCSPIHMKRLII